MQIRLEKSILFTTLVHSNVPSGSETAELQSDVI